MTKFDNARKELKKIGFYIDDENHLDDFQVLHHHIQGGVIAHEYSRRFSSFKKLVSFLEENLKTKSSKEYGTVSFEIKNSKVFNMITAYKENEINKVFLYKVK